MHYRTKLNPNLKRNFAVFAVLDWVVFIAAHIPNKGDQLVRYYVTYSDVSRGKRKKEKPETVEAVSWKLEVIEVPPHLQGVKKAMVTLHPKGLRNRPPHLSEV
ncbi:MAG: hypothetical protein O7B35_10560 [Deltaproteobacteria bacterium]|nr:hypothetical protein [Deltaproteobacteria bacterium]